VALLKYSMQEKKFLLYIGLISYFKAYQVKFLAQNLGVRALKRHSHEQPTQVGAKSVKKTS